MTFMPLKPSALASDVMTTSKIIQVPIPFDANDGHFFAFMSARSCKRPIAMRMNGFGLAEPVLDFWALPKASLSHLKIHRV